MKYIQDTKSGKRYRRRIPEAARSAFNDKSMFVKSLGSTHSEIIRKYPHIHEEYEQRVANALNPLAASANEAQTEVQAYQALIERMIARGFDPHKSGFDPDNHSDEQEFNKRDLEAERTIERYPADPKRHDPLNNDPYDPPTHEIAYVRALYSGVGNQPDPTFADAAKAYIEEKGLLNPGEKTKLDRVERVSKHVREALSRNPTLPSLKRLDARTVMRFIQNQGVSAGTVSRYLNDVRAIINHGILEFDLDCNNPFIGMNPQKDGPAIDTRRPFTNDEIVAISDRIATKAKPEIQLIWRLLRGTGCRNAEVVGLRRQDIHLDHEHPYISIEPHEKRRLKTNVSIRRVPLVGDALDAAEEALEMSERSDMVFVSYSSRGARGADAASQITMKHVRAEVGDDKSAVVYSLRHNMKDWLRLVGAPQHVQEQIAGRTSGGIGESYGGREAMLKVHHEWMLRVSERWPWD